MNFTEVKTSFGAGAAAISPNRISTLSKINRVNFDPRKKAHLDSVKKFLETGNWGDVQFYCEYPYTDVPMTVLTKFTAHKLGADLSLRHSLIAITDNG